MSKLKTALMAGIASVALAGAAQAEISGNVVKIGVLDDMSGVYADLAGEGSVLAARMAVEDAGGSVAGSPIEVISADHQNKADIAANVARQWIDTDQVDVVVDVGNSAAALAVQEVTETKGKVHLNSTAATTALTNEKCSPTGVHWTYDTYALANGTGKALVGQGAKKWFFITADYAFGHSLEENTSKAVKQAGGEVVGSVRAPFPNNDFSSYLLQAQGSGADVIAFANTGGDFVNALKQAQEFGITQSGQKIAGLLVFLTDVHSLGLESTKGLTITTGWYWDQDEDSRAWADRFAERNGGKRPTMVQAGVYSAVSHYLKAIAAIESDEGKPVVDQMKQTPINDMFAKNGKIREDGRMVHDMKLVQVKTPDESTGAWDYYKILANIPGDQAFMPLSESTCDLVKQ
ncbi:MAG: ABC transporter substrate-binding protein [Caenispirillum sp.]|nr:ABC transporter substrate-binding protein [Caenispirillum sp.]